MIHIDTDIAELNKVQSVDMILILAIPHLEVEKVKAKEDIGEGHLIKTIRIHLMKVAKMATLIDIELDQNLKKKKEVAMEKEDIGEKGLMIQLINQVLKNQMVKVVEDIGRSQDLQLESNFY